MLYLPPLVRDSLLLMTMACSIACNVTTFSASKGVALLYSHNCKAQLGDQLACKLTQYTGALLMLARLRPEQQPEAIATLCSQPLTRPFSASAGMHR